MLKTIDIQPFQRCGLIGWVVSRRSNQEGIAIIWILATILAFTVLGAAIVITSNVSLFGQVDASLSFRAGGLSESGSRFLQSEYENKTNDVDKNIVLDELNGKTFNIAPEGSGQFELDMTSYFYRVRTNPAGGGSLAVKFIANEGFTVPASGYLKVGRDETFYQYTSAPATAPDTDGRTIYTFTVSPNVPSTAVYTSVRQAIQTAIGSDINENGTLTLSSEQGALFPEENGMFLIEKEKIKATVPVKTMVPYRYEYRTGDQLINIQKGPHQSGFTTIDSGATLIEIAKLLSVESIGYAPDKTSALASETNTLQLSLDISTFSPGLKSYWSFDDAGTPGKDDYGTKEATLSDSGVTHTTAGMVGGALTFAGTGYVKTTFNPRAEIGNNQPFSVVFWAKPGTDVTNRQGVVGVYESGQDFYVGIRNGYWEWGLGNVTNYRNDTDTDWNLAGTPLPKAKPNEWQHIAFVYDRKLDDVVFYFNGIEYSRYEDFTTKGGIVTLPSRYIDIGALYDQNDQHVFNYTGTLDEIAVFNKAATIGEVSAIFNAPVATVPCNVGCDAVAYYPFDGNANDESGTDRAGSYDGAVFGATLTEDRVGLEAMAYSFDGNDSIRTTFNPKTVIGDGQPFTVVFWAKPSQTNVFQVIAGAHDLYAPERFYIGIWSTGQWIWGYGSAFGQMGTAVANQWVHVGLVFDGTDIVIYVNGTEYRTAYTGSGVLPNLNIDIGARYRGGFNRDSYFTGIIDEVVIWKVALTPAEMTFWYNATNP